MPIPGTSPGHLALLAWPLQVTGEVALAAISEAPGNAVRCWSAIQHLRKEGRVLAVSDLWENKTAVLGCQPMQRGAGEGQSLQEESAGGKGPGKKSALLGNIPQAGRRSWQVEET